MNIPILESPTTIEIDLCNSIKRANDAINQDINTDIIINENKTLNSIINKIDNELNTTKSDIKELEKTVKDKQNKVYEIIETTLNSTNDTLEHTIPLLNTINTLYNKTNITLKNNNIAIINKRLQEYREYCSIFSTFETKFYSLIKDFESIINTIEPDNTTTKLPPQSLEVTINSITELLLNIPYTNNRSNDSNKLPTNISLRLLHSIIQNISILRPLLYKSLKIYLVHLNVPCNFPSKISLLQCWQDSIPYFRTSFHSLIELYIVSQSIAIIHFINNLPYSYNSIILYDLQNSNYKTILLTPKDIVNNGCLWFIYDISLLYTTRIEYFFIESTITCRIDRPDLVTIYIEQCMRHHAGFFITVIQPTVDIILDKFPIVYEVLLCASYGILHPILCYNDNIITNPLNMRISNLLYKLIILQTNSSDIKSSINCLMWFYRHICKAASNV